MKAKAAADADIAFTHVVLSDDPSLAGEEEVVEAVQRLNGEQSVHGILVQLPLTDDIGRAGERRITESISPTKDVDGFHAYNIGLLSSRASDPLFPPCTPAGAMVLLESTGVKIAGKHAVVLGRSDIVGSPVCAMLRTRDATVTQCHSRTQNLPDIVRASLRATLATLIDSAHSSSKPTSSSPLSVNLTSSRANGSSRVSSSSMSEPTTSLVRSSLRSYLIC